MYVDDGQRVMNPTEDAAVASAVIVIDADGDGVDEVIAGTADGHVYAINAGVTDPRRGELEWAIEVGATVVQLAAADADDDGDLELLVANDRGEGLVIDDLGVFIGIDLITGCVGPGTYEVHGDARAVARVDLWLNGSPVGTPAEVSGERWTQSVELQRPGEYQLEARGLDAGGEVRVLATADLQVEASCPDEPEPEPEPTDEEECRSDCGEEDYDDGLIDRGCVWCGVGRGDRVPMELVVFGLLVVGLRRRVD